MLQEDDKWSMKAGDLVFHESIDGLLFLIVKNDLLLTDITQTIEVVEVSTGTTTRVMSIKNLMLEDGNILVMPSYLFILDNGDFQFTSAAEDIFVEILDKQQTTYLTDEECAMQCWIIM